LEEPNGGGGTQTSFFSERKKQQREKTLVEKSAFSPAEKREDGRGGAPGEEEAPMRGGKKRFP